MSSHPFKISTVVVTAALSVGVGLELSSASADTSSAYIETSQANPVSAQPAVTTPPTKSCTVTLADHFPSNAADGSPQSFSGTFTPPADCPRPWAKVVLTFSSSVTGRQFDRDASIELGGATIYFGTTQEPFGSTPKVATVSTDVTRFESLFQQPQQYSGGIGNYTSSVYTGVFDQTATLTFYEPDAAYPAPPEPNEVIGVRVPDLNPGSPSASLQLPVLPRNLTQADLEVTLKGNGCDEQWFTAVPNPVAAAEPYACGDGPYREA
ncbi:MAG TPA: peptide-N4-asparagine amidase, partial [Nocardioidaceae bacterium]|nr:peptide-N4-asparagine amidase [Nocardioidaceae bacterium]